MHEDIQRRIEEVYGLDNALNVADFIVKRSEAKGHPVLAQAMLPREEQLLVHEGEDALELALVYEDSVLHAFGSRPMRNPRTHQELELYCLAAEGVSHLLYAAWSAGQSRQFKQVELELQAEVDKYVLLVLADRDNPGRGSHWIRALFERFELHPSVGPDESERYLTANGLAKRYCTHLQNQYVDRGKWEAMVAELRSFYRWGAAKVPRLAAM